MGLFRINGNPVMLGLVGILTLGGGGIWSAKTALFQLRAERSRGVVTQVTSRFDRCKRGKSSYYDCTRFTAQVEFEDQHHHKNSTSISAGSRDGHCTDCRGSYVRGDQVPILYDPSSPLDARLDSFGTIWGGPLAVSGVGALFSLIGAVGVARRRY